MSSNRHRDGRRVPLLPLRRRLPARLPLRLIETGSDILGVMSLSMSPGVVRVLVANHARFLAFLERRVGRRDVAEEILQEAFVRGITRGGRCARTNPRSPGSIGCCATP